MNQNKLEYTLDFQIPCGGTGPTGPQGIQGPTGPTGPATLEALAYIEYTNTTTAEDLKITKNSILPGNSVVFQADLANNTLQINRTGNYEFTIAGAIKNFLQGERAGIYIQVLDNQSTLLYRQAIAIDAVVNESYFSRTFIFSSDKNVNVKVVYEKDNSSSNAFCENVILIVKKLAFGN